MRFDWQPRYNSRRPCQAAAHCKDGYRSTSCIGGTALDGVAAAVNLKSLKGLRGLRHIELQDDLGNTVFRAAARRGTAARLAAGRYGYNLAVAGGVGAARFLLPW